MPKYESRSTTLIETPLLSTSQLEKIQTLDHYVDALRPNPNDFRGVKAFKNTEINTDLQDTNTLKQNFTDQRRADHRSSEYLLGKAAESVLFFMFANRQIFSSLKDFDTTPGSHYDDHHNGADLICRFPDSHQSPVTFTCDATISSKPNVLSKKFDQSLIRRDSQSDLPVFCAPIKYYQEGARKLSLASAPHFIIGFSSNTCRAALDHSSINDQGVVRFANNPELKFKILTEILDQCVYHNYHTKALVPPRQNRRAARLLSKAQDDTDTISRLAAAELALLLPHQNLDPKSPTFIQDVYAACEPIRQRLRADDPTYNAVTSEIYHRWHQDFEQKQNSDHALHRRRGNAINNLNDKL